MMTNIYSIGWINNTTPSGFLKNDKSFFIIISALRALENENIRMRIFLL